MAARKARSEPSNAFGPTNAMADPIAIAQANAALDPGNNGRALERFTEYFKARFPDDWEALRLCPLQHGLDTMIEKLKA
jgi:hypothetical protein